ncbi:predicted protein [Sclerotinia sclerotiorum 1980 UF-70]|uniref:Uncharacterized protein n=1 Tax=Sclerotinia sclerotiorum (strain ATCC 18683 / 1980 / Ss-1) TaxID=665079 RepID=A7EFD7_SCLS1|nr:predicted protein [Sclerotinia sclerotiorum 1980 UF-70]EDO01553.1 predicted protein [Sclerotinia sclerotiorum 1980 UF-70]
MTDTNPKAVNAYHHPNIPPSEKSEIVPLKDIVPPNKPISISTIMSDNYVGGTARVVDIDNVRQCQAVSSKHAKPPVERH